MILFFPFDDDNQLGMTRHGLLQGYEGSVARACWPDEIWATFSYEVQSAGERSNALKTPYQYWETAIGMKVGQLTVLSVLAII